jgi:hypothetical protein
VKNFIIVAKGNRAEWDATSEADWEKVMDGFSSWIGALKAKDAWGGCHRLTGQAGWVKKQAGQVVDGPYVETKELLTGVFFIKATDMAEAMAVARNCPCLFHDTVDVHEVQSG